MLSTSFGRIYEKLRLHFYMSVFSNFEKREATLTTVESFSMEVISALGEPTIAEFAGILGISSPNAAHRIKCLIQKGYVKKVQSEDDARAFHLVPTKKYLDYSKINDDYVLLLIKRCKERFSEEDYKKLGEMLDIICSELMPEIDMHRESEAK